MYSVTSREKVWLFRIGSILVTNTAVYHSAAINSIINTASLGEQAQQGLSAM